MRFLRPELATWLLALPLAVAWWTFRRYARTAFLRNATLGDRARAASRVSTTRGDLVMRPLNHGLTVCRSVEITSTGSDAFRARM